MRYKTLLALGLILISLEPVPAATLDPVTTKGPSQVSLPVPAGGISPGALAAVTVVNQILLLQPPDKLFSDGFESGDTSAWSSTQ
jgi:hypothetical protein